MDYDFSFGDNPWELTLQALKSGSTLSAAGLLTLLEGQSEETVDDVLYELEQRHIRLNPEDITFSENSGAAAERLQLEQKFTCREDILRQLPDSDPLAVYLKELSSLSGDYDISACAADCAAGKESAQQQVTAAMLPSVVTQALSLTGKGVLLLDLIQEGSLGLWQGILCYTHRDLKSHCQWWIAQYQAKAIFLQARANGTGGKLRDALEAYQKADRALLTKLGRNPLPEEIADYMGISFENCQFLEKLLADARLQQQRTPQSQPEENPQEEEQSVEHTAYFQSRQRIADLLSGLSSQDADLLRLRYGLEGGQPLTPYETGLQLGLTAQQVIQRETAVLQQLRQQET